MTYFTPRERRYVWFFTCFTFLTRVILGFRGELNHASRLLLDDSFYMFSCARHLALGQGITADGVHLTNGIQPLLVFLEVPFFWLAGNDRWLGVQHSFVLFALFNAASVFLAGRMMARLLKQPLRSDEGSTLTDPVIICAGLWALSYPLFALMVNGLETGLYSMLLLLVIDRYITIENSEQRSVKQFALLGLLIGFLILARIDALFYLLAIGVFELVRYRKAAIPRIAMMGIVALLISSPWWIYNYTGFGSFMPTSGQAESIGAVDLGKNLEVALARFANISTAALALPYNYLPDVLQVLLSIAVLGIVFLVLRHYGLLATLRRQLRIAPLVPFASAAFVLAIIYVVHFHAPYFLDRYFQPIRIIWLFCAAVLIAEAYRKYDARLLRWGVRVFTVVAVGYFAVAYAMNFTPPHLTDLYRTGLWAKQHPESIVGIEQSGVAGFIADNVCNLDGKMNPDVMRAIQNGTMPEYIKTQKFPYLADWDSVINELLVTSHAVSDYKLIDSIERVRIYQRIK